MKRWLFRMQNKYRNFGIENLMMYVTVTMLAVYLLWHLTGADVTKFVFSRYHILQGQVWRLLTFVVIPPIAKGAFSVLLQLYIYYFLGNSLERYWGSFSFTVYYLFGIVGAIVAGMITGLGDNTYINTSLLLAFAMLFPETEFMLFFLIPIKVKYIGMVTAAFYALGLIYAVVTLQWPMAAAMIASLINFFLFFGSDLIYHYRERRRYAARRRQFRKDTKNFRDRF